MVAPCKNCPDRSITCHSTCRKYLDYVKERELARERKYRDNNLTSAIIEIKIKGIK